MLAIHYSNIAIYNLTRKFSEDILTVSKQVIAGWV